MILLRPGWPAEVSLTLLLQGRYHYDLGVLSQPEAIQQRIAELMLEHRDLDSAIDALSEQIPHDELQLRRLKKRKLQTKDAIALLQMHLTPDIPA